MWTPFKKKATPEPQEVRSKRRIFSFPPETVRRLYELYDEAVAAQPGSYLAKYELWKYINWVLEGATAKWGSRRLVIDSDHILAPFIAEVGGNWPLPVALPDDGPEAIELLHQEVGAGQIEYVPIPEPKRRRRGKK